MYPVYNTNKWYTCITNNQVVEIYNHGEFALLPELLEDPSVPHSIMLKAADHLGACTEAMEWISSYLSNHQQHVSSNASCSDWSSVSSGVPQSGVCAPFLFVLVIDSLAPICTNSTFVKYADNVTVLHSTSICVKPSLSISTQNNSD